MDFAHLDRLWLLLLLPVFYWLARPPRPRRSDLTPHLTQWRAALARLRRQPIRFRWLRFWLLVLATCALVFAATRPTLGARPGPDQLVVVVDGSASMLAPGVREEVERVLAEVSDVVPDHVRVRAVFAKSVPEVFERPARAACLQALEHALGDTTQFRAGTDLGTFAEQVVSADVRVLTITDGLGAGSVPTRGALRCVGAPNPANVGIVACNVEDAWPLPFVDVRFEVSTGRVDREHDRADVEVRLEPHNSGAATEPVVERVTCKFETTDSASVGRREMRLRRPKGSRDAMVLSVRVQHTAVAGDGFGFDDVVRFELPALPAPDVVLLGRDPAGAETAPWAVAAAETIAELGGGRVVSQSNGRAGFVLVEGGQLATLPPRAILFGTRVGVDVQAEPPRDSFDPPVVDWARSDPLLAGIDLSELRISGAMSPEHLPPGGEVLIEGAEGPLAVAIPRPDGARTVCLAFRLDQSNLPLLPALPQILGRAYRAAWGDDARVRALSSVDGEAEGTNLLLPAESDLTAHQARLSRPLGPFGDPGVPLAVPLLLLGLLALALRAWF